VGLPLPSEGDPLELETRLWRGVNPAETGGSCVSTELPGENVEFWDAWALHGYDDNMQNENYQAMARRIVADVGGVDRALDVATGTGLAAFELARRVGVVDGVDFSPEMIAIARRKAADMDVANVRFGVQSAYELLFPDCAFDAVVIANAVHSMESPQRALAEARRVLKPNGVLVVPTPCHGENEETLAQIQKIMESGFKDYQLFSGDRLAEMVTRCGFRVTGRDTIQWVFPETGFRMLVEHIVARPA